MKQVNDVSFLIGDRLVVFVEHQSTINYNMPLRMFIYGGRIYEKITASDNIYRERMLQIPRAEFYVLYNGPGKFPERATMKLSDMFPPDNKKNKLGLELSVDIYNINSGYNPDLFRKCKPVYEYQTFVELIDRCRRETGDLKKAARLAVAECTTLGILTEFLKRYASEVENMIFTKWNTEDAKRIWQEEAMEEGIGIGVEKGIGIGVDRGIGIGVERGILQMAEAMKAKGIDVNTIAEITGMEINDILKM
jgi:hypothetical protein